MAESKKKVEETAPVQSEDSAAAEAEAEGTQFPQTIMDRFNGLWVAICEELEDDDDRADLLKGLTAVQMRAQELLV